MLVSTLGAPPADAWSRSGAAGDGWASCTYQEHQFQRAAIKILPGEFYVTRQDVVLTTVLGSCVSVCLRDAEAGAGGMNHFMLPDTTGASSARFGSFAMEVLINELFKQGARRQHLQAKVFGGGAVMGAGTGQHVGLQNIHFALSYLATEGIQVISRDLGTSAARKLCYFPVDGRALVRHLPASGTESELSGESQYRARLAAEPTSGAVELFTEEP